LRSRARSAGSASLGLLRPALPGAVPALRRRRLLVRAFGVHRDDRRCALGDPPARAGDREPLLRRCARAGRAPPERPRHARPHDDRRPVGRGARRARRRRRRRVRRDRRAEAGRSETIPPSTAKPEALLMESDVLLATADSCLLAPYELQKSRLEAVFRALQQRKLDAADLYFQYTRSEGWSLEEGIVKSGSFNIDQGVGVRAIAGEKTAFAYSDEISYLALEDAARATRAIGHAGQSGSVAVRGRKGRKRQPLVAARSRVPMRYEPIDPLASLAAEDKVRMLEKLERICRAKDPR